MKSPQKCHTKKISKINLFIYFFFKGLLVDLLIMWGGNSGSKGDDGAIAIATTGLCLFGKRSEDIRW